MSQKITVKDLQRASTFTTYVALIVIVTYLFCLTVWFPEFYTSPVAVVGFGISLLTVLWNGEVHGVAGFVERASESGKTSE